MAYFIQTDNTVTLMHNTKKICTFKMPSQEDITNKTGATFSWSNDNISINGALELNQTTLTITTPGNLASFVVSAFKHGYSLEKYLFGQKDGKQVMLNRLNRTFCLQNYKNGVLQEEYQKTGKIYSHKKWDKNRGAYHIFTKETFENGSVIRKSYYLCDTFCSQIKYRIHASSGRLLEEGCLNANNQKHGTIITYAKNERRTISYYENGEKLTLGQRLFGFKRKITSHQMNTISQPNELTR